MGDEAAATNLLFGGPAGFSPVIDPRFTYRSENVVEALDKACARLGYPKAIRVDQGTEFVSRNLDLWAYAHGVTLDFSQKLEGWRRYYNEDRPHGATGNKTPITLMKPGD